MTVSIIVAVARNGAIGLGGDLPWRLPADLRRFRDLTMGFPMVMGRKTYDSIGRPLPGRKSIVVTRNPDYIPSGIEGREESVSVAQSFEEAIALAGSAERVFVIGGEAIFRLALPLADRIYWTRVEAEVDGDVFFPELDASTWKLVEDEPHPADDRNEYPFRFCVYERA